MATSPTANATTDIEESRTESVQKEQHPLATPPLATDRPVACNPLIDDLLVQLGGGTKFRFRGTEQRTVHGVPTVVETDELDFIVLGDATFATYPCPGPEIYEANGTATLLCYWGERVRICQHSLPTILERLHESFQDAVSSRMIVAATPTGIIVFTWSHEQLPQGDAPLQGPYGDKIYFLNNVTFAFLDESNFPIVREILHRLAAQRDCDIEGECDCG